MDMDIAERVMRGGPYGGPPRAVNGPGQPAQAGPFGP